jgi:hypothetical protein
MRVAYLTLDEVNRALAIGFAAQAGIELELPELRDDLNRFDAVLYDLDFLPAECRDRLRFVPGGGELPQVVAVHSYNLTPRQRRSLHRRGALVTRRLRASLFKELRQLARAKKADAADSLSPTRQSGNSCRDRPR